MCYNNDFTWLFSYTSVIQELKKAQAEGKTHIGVARDEDNSPMYGDIIMWYEPDGEPDDGCISEEMIEVLYCNLLAGFQYCMLPIDKVISLLEGRLELDKIKKIIR